MGEERQGKLSRYVAESGCEEFDGQHTRVARNRPAPHTPRLADLTTHAVRELSHDALPGIGDDPLADLAAAQKLAPLNGNRAVRIDDDGAAIEWSANGTRQGGSVSILGQWRQLIYPRRRGKDFSY